MLQRSMNFVLSVTLTLSFCISSAHAENWWQFRGPGGNGASTATNLPTSWGESNNLIWTTEMPGAGSSSPIILGDRVYLSCYSGYGLGTSNSGSLDDLKLHVVCVTRNNGKIAWNTTVQPKPGESERVRDHGYAAPTPVTDGKHLYVFFGKSGVYKFDLNGKQIWNSDVGSDTHGWGCGTSPVLYKNLVIVNASVESGSLVALDKQTGDEAWRSPGMNRSWNTPILVDLKNGKQELVVSVRGRILGFDPTTGKQLWNCEGVQDYVCPSAVARDGVVYVIGGRKSVSMAIRAGGRGDVTKSHRIWKANAGANVSSPVIFGDHLYWVSDRNQVAYCLRLDTGEVVYQKRTRIKPYASTVVADGKLFVVTRFDGIHVLAAKPEFEELSHNEFADESTFNASPAVAGGKLFIRSDRYLYCVGKEG